MHRIAILGKGQSSKIANTCGTIPGILRMGLFWDVTSGVNIDLDASTAVFDSECKPLGIVAFSKLVSNDLAIRHCGD